MEQSFESILETLPSNSKLRLYNLTTPKTKTHNLIKNKVNSNETTFFEKSLILLALDTTNLNTDLSNEQLQNSPNANLPNKTQSITSETNHNFQFVAAIQAIRYTVHSQNPDLPPNNPPHQILYIEKVDSVPAHISTKDKLIGYARLLVIAYLNHHLAKNLNTSIYTFSKAQPEYLFARSSKNPAKTILENHHLNAWWKTTLEIAIKYYLITKPCRHPENSESPQSPCEYPQFYCYLPNADKNSIHWLRESPQATEAAKAGIPANSQVSATGSKRSIDEAPIAVLWKSGFPFADQACAGDSFYCFPDDPIARLLEKKSNRCAPVSLFLDLLSITEECGVGHQVAFFNIVVGGGRAALHASAGNGAVAAAGSAASPAGSWADHSGAHARISAEIPPSIRRPPSGTETIRHDSASGGGGGDTARSRSDAAQLSSFASGCRHELAGCVAARNFDDFVRALFDYSIDFSSTGTARSSTAKLASSLEALVGHTDIRGRGPASPNYDILLLLAAKRAASRPSSPTNTSAGIAPTHLANANCPNTHSVNVLNANLVKRRKKN
ncbi:hypothetical protein AYI69_g9609 [Smittium culicis]|uniref:histone acetyltransferase n=1 Tax=Smittium culicis TaxID=133412 RepID=A0A1R1XBJ9_9FUNG|nr:hypothetical protein AYI69_g9609 [Smittium culicis]